MTEQEPSPLSVFQHAIGVYTRWSWPVQITQRAVPCRDEQLDRTSTRLVDTMTWTGAICPGQLCATYTVRFIFTDGDHRVHIDVADPALDPGAADELPHVNGDGTLCLHDFHEWDQSQPIATTIIPWTYEWLYHYELWMGIGTWTGGGDTYTKPIRPLDGLRLRATPGSSRRAFTRRRSKL